MATEVGAVQETLMLVGPTDSTVRSVGGSAAVAVKKQHDQYEDIDSGLHLVNLIQGI